MAQRRKSKRAKDQDGIIIRLVKWEQASSDYRKAYVIGWQNIIDGADWHPAYDSLPKLMQEGYEHGRLDAMNIKGAGFEVPFFGSISKRPDDVIYMINKAAVKWNREGKVYHARPKRTIVNKFGDFIEME